MHKGPKFESGGDEKKFWNDALGFILEEVGKAHDKFLSTQKELDRNLYERHDNWLAEVSAVQTKIAQGRMNELGGDIMERLNTEATAIIFEYDKLSNNAEDTAFKV